METQLQDIIIDGGTMISAELFTPQRLTPTGKISHAKTRVYTQRYRKEWEESPEFKGKETIDNIHEKYKHLFT